MEEQIKALEEVKKAAITAAEAEFKKGLAELGLVEISIEEEPWDPMGGGKSYFYSEYVSAEQWGERPRSVLWEEFREFKVSIGEWED